MTVAAPAECWWLPQDGAPAGPEFEFTIPSSRPGHGPYTIARGAAAGIAHYPRCEAWVHGRRMCRHVREALLLAEHPAQAFMEQVHAILSKPGWYQAEQAVSALAAVKRALDDARRQLAENESAARYRAEREATPQEERGAQAVAEFGGVQ